MQTASDHDQLHPDAQAVDAIRQGDRERFRELVDRYASKVFAVAWCRLGDRDLAEEAAQEAFINAYRRLPLLSHAEKFGSWITTIARNAAINLGLRHRSELQKRKRWALEQTNVAGDAGQSAEDPLLTAETVRGSVAKLPPIHRECLILYYLQGHSVAESATLLGLSETAFKVRLHRARGALRSQLESYLEQSLGQLRPSAQFGALVMLALPSVKPMVPLAGGLLGSAGQAFIGKSGLFLSNLLTVVPALAVNWWIGTRDIANFRDQDGFRAANYRRSLKVTTVFIAVTTIIIFALNHTLGVRAFAQVSALLSAAFLVASTRPLYLIRNPLAVGAWCGVLLFTTGLIGIGFFDLSFVFLMMMQGLFFFVMSFLPCDRSAFVNASLFLRASNGLFQSSAPVETGPETRLRLSDLFRFGKFLGDRMLIVDWKADAASLALRLAPLTPSQFTQSLPTVWRGASQVRLDCTGQVTAHFGARDQAAMRELASASPASPGELEARVAASIKESLAALLEGHLDRAAAALGEVAPDEIYRVAPEKAFPAVFRRWVLRGCGVFIIAIAFYLKHSLVDTQRAVESAALKATAAATPDRPRPTMPTRPTRVLEPGSP